MLVVDASVLAPAVADGGAEGAGVRQRLRGEELAGPDLLRVEVTAVLRRQLATGHLQQSEAAEAFGALLSLPLLVYPTAALISRAWELRADVTAYDACYVALAEALDCALFTADRRLLRAPGIHCEVVTVGT